MSEDKQMPKYWNAAVADVINERVRHMKVEHWTTDHDDYEHEGGDLAYAGAAYSWAAAAWQNEGIEIYDADNPPACWPPGWEFRPADPRRMLVKAAALLIAEIERLDRKEQR